MKILEGEGSVVGGPETRLPVLRDGVGVEYFSRQTRDYSILKIRTFDIYVSD